LTLVLSFGVLSTPVPASAGILSLVFGGETPASAEVLSVAEGNSQNMIILEAKVSPLAMLDKKSTESEKNTIALSTSIVSDSALAPTVGPLAAADVGAIGGGSFDQVSVYVVRKGDSLSQIAEMYGVSVDTILSANDMKKGDVIKEGDILLILPFSGIEHTVIKGDTLQGIAKKYKIPLDDILLSNDIDASTKLAIGDKLMIPGGSLSNTSSTSSGSIAKTPSSISSSQKTVSGYFINPVPGARKTRGASSTHRGVDLAAPTGTTIYASAAGRVTFARAGYNGGFGNLIIISHSNGTETLYAHLSKIITSVGAQVSQGEAIGHVGSSGRSTGPHLHFEVHGAKNPGQDWSWAN
jgi:LysM repeat protein